MSGTGAVKLIKEAYAEAERRGTKVDARDERGTVLGAYDFTTAKKECLWGRPR